MERDRTKGMNVIINIETHFIVRGDEVYAESLMDKSFWRKYLNVFDKLYVIARMRDYSGEDLSKWIRSDCENVIFLRLPDYRGPKGYAIKYVAIGRLIKRYVREHSNDSCAIIRSPSPIGYRFLKEWRNTKESYGMEITANMTDSYYYSIDFIHSILYGRLNKQTKRYALEADGVAYVTKTVLQKAYPTKGISANYSSIDLPKELFFKREPIVRKKGCYTLIHVSTLSLDVKGNEEFFLVQKKLLDDGYDVNSVVIGGGRFKEHYVRRVDELGIKDKVRFTGHISKKEVLMNELRKADILLFPTLSEGLPRTVIEAMANSLPVVSSDIPSMRELIEEKWLCNPKDVDGFVQKIKMLIEDVDLYNKTALRNYGESLEYEYQNLNKRRTAFYKSISMRK